ncbi:fungal hydrophobin domain-containing protein [Penicillium tannophilum]|nr:fungal hydrophobin domain-containing protein [Penicillium tannophilum]
MKASILLIAVSAGAALAQPSSFVKRDSVCPSILYSVPQCCSIVLNSPPWDCSTPSSADDIADFKASCSSSGGTPQCCTVPGATEFDLCTDAIGA